MVFSSPPSHHRAGGGTKIARASHNIYRVLARVPNRRYAAWLVIVKYGTRIDAPIVQLPMSDENGYY